jgi:hypothetical protein
VDTTEAIVADITDIEVATAIAAVTVERRFGVVARTAAGADTVVAQFVVAEVAANYQARVY